MKTYLYKLKFLTPIHLSSDPLSLGKAEIILHSDTLFSAIANSFSMLYDMEESFFSSPPFTISSAFPYYRDTIFFPKPTKLKISPGQFEKSRKKIKKAKFVSERVFNKFINGEEISISEKNFHNTDFISEKPIEETIYVMQERPRSAIPRANGETTIFYSNAVKFGENSGLYFFATFESENIKKQFDSALYLLGDSGIGGERSAGYGKFTFKSEEAPEIGKKDGKYFIALSLYYPNEDEIKSGILQNARYSILTRQNWIFSGTAQPIRSKSVRMFAEGSIFKNTINAKGKIADITPEIAKDLPHKLSHPVMRYGKLFKVLISEEAVE